MTIQRVNESTLPTFLICGAQKCGTTTLFNVLKSHPQIFLPQQKELNYFNHNWANPLQTYAEYFSQNQGKAIIGEPSPFYMIDPLVPTRIAATLGRPKLDFILRNPIDRAYSNYWFNVSRLAQSPRISFIDSIHTMDGQERYISKGYYAKHLDKFYANFPLKTF